jgi:hypothetical protein
MSYKISMYALDEIASDLDSFRHVAATQTAYRPLYVTIKLNYGSNLSCEMCNHWRVTREPPLLWPN